MHIKICGITETDEVALLGRSAADLAGIWHGIEGGYADVPFERFSHLAREITDVGRLEPVLVTFLNEAHKLSDVIARSGVEWVQLHGFQPPSVVSELRAAFGAGLRIIKVLHVLGQRCLEGSLSKAYERAGASFILFDAATPDGRLAARGNCWTAVWFALLPTG